MKLQDRQLLDPIGRGALVIWPEGEPGALGRRLAFDHAGLEAVAGDLDRRGEGALGAEDIGHVVERHPVLEADRKALGGQDGLISSQCQRAS